MRGVVAVLRGLGGKIVAAAAAQWRRRRRRVEEVEVGLVERWSLVVRREQDKW